MKKKIKKLVLALLAVVTMSTTTKAENLINTTKMENAVAKAASRFNPTIVYVDNSVSAGVVTWTVYLDSGYAVSTHLIVQIDYYSAYYGLQHAVLEIVYPAGQTVGTGHSSLYSTNDFVSSVSGYTILGAFPGN